MNEQLRQAIGMANLRRRIRAITYEDVVQVLDEARRTGIGWHLAGRVAKSYRHEATTAAVACVRVKQEYFVRVGCPDAHANASDVTWFGPRSRRDRDILEWRKEVLAHPDDLKNWIRISRREVLTLLRARTREARARIEALVASVPDVIISGYHSIRAGNCPQETERIARAFHHKPTSARTVAAAFPELVTYIRKAADYALLDEEHTHRCQQCDKVIRTDCHCDEGPNTMEWCSANCRAAFDL